MTDERLETDRKILHRERNIGLVVAHTGAFFLAGAGMGYTEQQMRIPPFSMDAYAGLYGSMFLATLIETLYQWYSDPLAEDTTHPLVPIGIAFTAGIPASIAGVYVGRALGYVKDIVDLL